MFDYNCRLHVVPVYYIPLVADQLDDVRGKELKPFVVIRLRTLETTFCFHPPHGQFS
jgi:hypothetical protein